MGGGETRAEPVLLRSEDVIPLKVVIKSLAEIIFSASLLRIGSREIGLWDFTSNCRPDEEDTKLLYEGIVEERKEGELLEERKRRDNLELEKLRIEAQIGRNQEILSRNNRTTSNELNRLLHKFYMKEDISLYLILFERQACMMDVPKEFWVSHLLGLLPKEITQLITREPEQEARDYDHVRSLLLKRFKLTPEKFRQLFVTHQKSSDKTWRDFYQEVQNSLMNGLKDWT
ncbi:homeotic protein female sterile [Trichonephila clavipes]|nr:homeotic protein female sterile [Trichonephila clavipes]